MDGDDWLVDLERIGRDAIPPAILGLLFGFLAFVPLSIADVGVLPELFVLLAQVVLSVGESSSPSSRRRDRRAGRGARSQRD